MLFRSKEVQVHEDKFVIVIETDDDFVLNNIKKMAGKMQKTVDECRRVVIGRTPYVITQKSIELRSNNEH